MGGDRPPGSETAPSGDASAVLLCADLASGPARIDLTALSGALGRRPGHAFVSVPGELCREPRLVTAGVRSSTANRVVVACGAGPSFHADMAAHARRGGAFLGAIEVVDLVPVPDADGHRVLSEAGATIGAALARVQNFNPALPLVEGPSTGMALSRRSLFTLTRPIGRPVATRAAGRCEAGTLCSLCAKACPTGAISTGAGGPQVETGSCTGCGICVTTCGSGRFVVPGAALGQLEAALQIVARDAAGSPGGRGVALVCRHARRRAWLGSGWLPVVLPSLEMVTLGWPLQILASGPCPVALAPCAAPSCTAHAELLAGCCEALFRRPGRVGERPGPIDVGPAGLPDASKVRLVRRAGPPARISLAEPMATLQALRTFAGCFDQEPSFRLVNAASPLGAVSLRSSGCTLCGACAVACPRSALSVVEEPDGPGGSTTKLTFSAADCVACGRCVAACPESVLDVARALRGEAVEGVLVTLAEAAARRCTSCGGPLPSGQLADNVILRLAASHPRLAEQLKGRCPRCRAGTPARPG